MKLTFIICRILTISLLASAGGMFFLNKEKLSSLRVAIQKSLTEKSSANNLLEKDKEASGNLLNGLFRQRGEVRMITEENISSAEETKKEAEFLTPQMPDLEKRIAELTSDLNDAKSDFSYLEDKVSQAINVIKNSGDKVNIDFFDAYLLLIIDSLKKKDFKKAEEYLPKITNLNEFDRLYPVITGLLKNFIYTFNKTF